MNHHKTYTFQEAQKALEYYCSYQERTHREVEQKLQSMGMIPEVCEKIVISLLENDFLNEERFAKTYVRGKFSVNRWGKIKIKQALFKKGISKANVEIGLLEIEDDEYFQTLENLANKQRPKIKSKNDYERKQKLLRYLQLKGYETALVFDCVMNDDFN